LAAEALLDVRPRKGSLICVKRDRTETERSNLYKMSAFNKFTQAEAEMFRKFTHLMFS